MAPGSVNIFGRLAVANSFEKIDLDLVAAFSCKKPVF